MIKMIMAIDENQQLLTYLGFEFGLIIGVFNFPSLLNSVHFSFFILALEAGIQVEAEGAGEV